MFKSFAFLAALLLLVCSGAEATGEGIFIVGGTNFNDWDMDRVELQANTNTPWENQVSLQAKRSHLAAASVGGMLYAIGGSWLDHKGNFRTTVYDSVEMLDTSDPADEWSYGPSLQTARHSLAAATINGVIYVSGGYTGSGFFDYTATASVEMLDTNNLTSVWSDGPPLQTARSVHAAAALNGMLYVIGGFPSGADNTMMSASGGNLLATVEVLDTSDLAGGWSYGPPLQTKRAGHAAAALNGMLYVVGGVDPGWVTFAKNIEILDTNNLAGGWSDGPPLQTARQALVAAPLNGMICVIGGYTAPQEMGGTYLSTVELLDPSDLAAGWSYGLPTNFNHESHAGAAFNANVDCAGTWSACTAACEKGSARTFTTTTGQSGAGAVCPVAVDCQPGSNACVGVVLTGDEDTDLGGASTLSMSLYFTTLLAAVVTVLA